MITFFFIYCVVKNLASFLCNMQRNSSALLKQELCMLPCLHCGSVGSVNVANFHVIIIYVTDWNIGTLSSFLKWPMFKFWMMWFDWTWDNKRLLGRDKIPLRYACFTVKWELAVLSATHKIILLLTINYTSETVLAYANNEQRFIWFIFKIYKYLQGIKLVCVEQTDQILLVSDTSSIWIWLGDLLSSWNDIPCR